MNSPFAGHRIYLDASALIYAVESHDQFHGLRNRIFKPFALGQLTLVTSWITLAEVSARPARDGDSRLLHTYRQFLTPSRVFEIHVVGDEVSEEAARLRAAFRFKLPDAIHVATGKLAGCSHFLTGDGKWAQAGIALLEPSNL